MELPPHTCDELRRLIHRLCGVVLTPDKAYLVRHRLEPLVRKSGCGSFDELARRLREPGGTALHNSVIEAITTGETSFFRDGHPFDTFRQHLLPLLIESAQRRAGLGSVPRVRLWCAAASTGQEPYSLAMLVRDYLDAARVPAEFSILATDVSAAVLAKAAAGDYDHRELSRGVSPAVLHRHFQKRGRHHGVRDEVRRLVEFRRVNLVESVLGLGTFDAIFCRNLLIYFDEATRRRLCAEFAAMLPVGGWLVLGAAENLYGVSERFESVRFGETLLFRR